MRKKIMEKKFYESLEPSDKRTPQAFIKTADTILKEFMIGENKMDAGAVEIRQYHNLGQILHASTGFVHEYGVIDVWNIKRELNELIGKEGKKS